MRRNKLNEEGIGKFLSYIVELAWQLPEIKVLAEIC